LKVLLTDFFNFGKDKMSNTITEAREDVQTSILNLLKSLKRLSEFGVNNMSDNELNLWMAVVCYSNKNLDNTM